MNSNILHFPGPKQKQAQSFHSTLNLAFFQDNHRFILISTTILFALSLFICIAMYPQTFTSRVVLRSLEPRPNQPESTVESEYQVNIYSEQNLVPAVFQIKYLKSVLLPVYAQALQKFEQQKTDALHNHNHNTRDESALLTKLEDSYRLNFDPATGLIKMSWQDRTPELTAYMLDQVIKTADQQLTRIADSRTVAVQNHLDRQISGLEEQLTNADYELTPKSRQEADTRIYAELKKQQALAKIENRKARYDLAVLDNPFIPEKPDSLPLNWLILTALIFSTALTLSCIAAWATIKSYR